MVLPLAGTQGLHSMPGPTLSFGRVWTRPETRNAEDLLSRFPNATFALWGSPDYQLTAATVSALTVSGEARLLFAEMPMSVSGRRWAKSQLIEVNLLGA